MLEGSDIPWTVAVLGAGQPTNVELVQRAVALCQEVGGPVATPAVAAALLGVPATTT